jgi:hypothetical protein
MPELSERVFLRELLKEANLHFWMPIADSAIKPKPIEILGLESALHLPRVKILLVFPSDLMGYWGEVQALVFNILRVFNIYRPASDGAMDCAILFGEEALLSELSEVLCRRTSARKILSFGVNLKSFEKQYQENQNKNQNQNKNKNQEETQGNSMTFGGSLNFKIEYVKTQHLKEVWENPILKKQVWNDVSSAWF